MKFYDDMRIQEMEEGKQYAITQGGNGFSDGVWVVRHGDEIEVRHFWSEITEEDQEKDIYTYHEEDNVWYPRQLDDDRIDVVHKDLMQVIPDAIGYIYEDMTLSEHYELVVMGVNGLYWEGYRYPKHLKGKFKTYDREKNLLFTN